MPNPCVDAGGNDPRARRVVRSLLLFVAAVVIVDASSAIRGLLAMLRARHEDHRSARRLPPAGRKCPVAGRSTAAARRPKRRRGNCAPRTRPDPPGRKGIHRQGRAAGKPAEPSYAERAAAAIATSLRRCSAARPFSSDRACSRSGNAATAKNKATVNPIAAVIEADGQFDDILVGERRRSARPAATAAPPRQQDAERLPDRTTARTSHVPVPTDCSGTPAFTRPKRT